jgi:hypothetical protein
LGVCTKWYQSYFLSVYYRQKEAEKEKKNTLIHAQVVSELLSICILRAKGGRKGEEKHSDTCPNGIRA